MRFSLLLNLVLTPITTLPKHNHHTLAEHEVQGFVCSFRYLYHNLNIIRSDILSSLKRLHRLRTLIRDPRVPWHPWTTRPVILTTAFTFRTPEPIPIRKCFLTRFQRETITQYIFRRNVMLLSSKLFFQLIFLLALSLLFSLSDNQFPRLLIPGGRGGLAVHD